MPEHARGRACRWLGGAEPGSWWLLCSWCSAVDTRGGVSEMAAGCGHSGKVVPWGRSGLGFWSLQKQVAITLGRPHCDVSLWC